MSINNLTNEILRIELSDILEKKLTSQPIILLGDSSHGDTSAELLANRYYFTPALGKIDTLFLEGIPYNNGVNWGSAPLASLTASEKKRLQTAREFSLNIYGLETEKTAPSNLSNANKLKFAEERRNTACFPIWSQIIDDHMDFEGGLNVALIGAAHLSTVNEKKGIVPPLQTSFRPPDGAAAFAVAMIDESLEIDRIEDYTPIQKTKYYAVHGLNYIPTDGITSIPLILNPWPDPTSDDDVIESLL